MNLLEKLASIESEKYCMGKSYQNLEEFSAQIGARSMFHPPGLGFGIPTDWSAENQMRGIFNSMPPDGVFIFNVAGVDIERARQGFNDFEEANGNNIITEWELSIILSNEDYKERTIFHDGTTEILIA